ncbi:imidazole glycerol phosphate synthase subunit HisH [Planctomycetales bacterium]|nr:imidazole glycerol phosphate synthase subunit HisH [Planctomycetales bacterium]
MLAIVDYKAGNLTSVKLSLETLGITGTITSDPDIVAKADRIIFPGVGAAGSAMQNLRDFGLDSALRDAVKRGTPLLGICVGMQVLLDFSEEDGGTNLLGLIPGNVIRFQPKSSWDKVPQMGWNNVSWNNNIKAERTFSGIENGSDFYFVHSYYPVPENPAAVLAETEYASVRFASALCCENITATQFHPEKSGKNGLRVLKNFVYN